MEVVFQGRHSDGLSLNTLIVLTAKVHALVTCNSRTICLDVWPIKQQSYS